MYLSFGIAGIVDAYSLESKRAELSRFAVPWTSFAHGRYIPAPMVFVHICEYAQVISDPELGEDVIRDIVSMERATYQDVVDQVMADLAAENTNEPGRVKSHTQIILKKVAGLRSADTSSAVAGGHNLVPAIEGPSSAPAGAKTRPKSAGAKSRSCKRPGRSQQGRRPDRSLQVKAKTKLKMQWQVNAKVLLRCEVCGRTVRKDVIARHQQTEVCKPSKQGSV